MHSIQRAVVISEVVSAPGTVESALSASAPIAKRTVLETYAPVRVLSGVLPAAGLLARRALGIACGSFTFFPKTPYVFFSLPLLLIQLSIDGNGGCVLIFRLASKPVTSLGG